MKKEITNIDGERLANVIFMWLFIPWIIAVPIIFILFLCGVKIEEVELTLYSLRYRKSS